MVVPDGNLVPGGLADARQRPTRIEVVIEYRDLHHPIPSASSYGAQYSEADIRRLGASATEATGSHLLPAEVQWFTGPEASLTDPTNAAPGIAPISQACTVTCAE